MQIKDLLRQLDFGSSVAEHDSLLKDYFVETETFRALVQDKADVIAGDKGTGKSALYRILSERSTQVPELASVEVISAFNPAGAPVFQRLAESEILSEAHYSGIWKAYFLALAGNWILELASGDYTDDMRKLDRILAGAQLRSPDDSATGVFSRIINFLKRGLGVKAAEGAASITAEGLPVIGARVEFDGESNGETPELVRHDDALRLLNSILRDLDFTVWLAVDRLDEAFQSSPNLERPVLRALFRSYLDLQELDHLKLKLFVRRDLFRRIITGGFVNLSHINARKIEIIWDEADLLSLLHKRVRENSGFMSSIGLTNEDTAEDVFEILFPTQVDAGDRRPTTFTWMMGRIRDGNQVKPPRNLIDLALKAREAQLRQEDRKPQEFSPGIPLISSEALKRGLDALSAQRVEDTLLAEAGDKAYLIDRFRGGKAEHNETSLSSALGNDYPGGVKYLAEIGFLERVGSSYKIPMLYRGGLDITQGKAFTAGPASDSDEDD